MNYYSDVVGYTGNIYVSENKSLTQEIAETRDKLDDLNDERELLVILDNLGIDLDVLKRLLKKER